MRNKEKIFLVEESAEGEYEARALGYSIYTEEESNIPYIIHIMNIGKR